MTMAGSKKKSKSSKRASTTRNVDKSKALESVTEVVEHAPEAPPSASRLPRHALVLAGIGLASAGLVIFLIKKLVFKGNRESQEKSQGKFAKVKPTVNCVPLADGSACVVKRPIPGDNSCLFNAIGSCILKSMSKAPYLRSVVAQEVAANPELYSTAFLGEPNAAYCRWIQQRDTWGGGVELSILSRVYSTEIAAWNVETCKCLIFGEGSGYKKRAFVLYNGVHYDALGLAEGTPATAAAVHDVTTFNPRTPRGKEIMKAAKKLVKLNHLASKFESSAAKVRVRCSECRQRFFSTTAVKVHTKATGHTRFEEL